MLLLHDNGGHDFVVLRVLVLMVTDVSVKPADTIFRFIVIYGY
jgi:hypothetical protein